MRQITKAELFEVSFVHPDQAPHPAWRVTHIDGKAVHMSESTSENHESDVDVAAAQGINPDTGVPDNRFHGSPEDPIAEDYNVGNLENAEKSAEEADSTEPDQSSEGTDESQPDAVDATAEGADSAPEDTGPAGFNYRS